jgi:cytochrome c
MKKIVLSLGLLTSLAFAQSAEELMQSNGCFNCHAIASKKNAPAFAGIAKRNKMQNGANAKTIIINAIKNGSKGKYPHFSDMEMPSFTNFSDAQLNTMADFILAQSSKHKGNCQGGRGMGKGRGNGGGMGRNF